jgi:hypothetical protein
MPRQRLSLAAGSEELPRSSVWEVRSTRNQVYLGSRFAMGFFKVSLHHADENHPDHDWRVAQVTRPDAPPNPDRVWVRWTRPAEFAPGWTEGPSIIIVYSDIDEAAMMTQLPWSGAKRPITWVDGPHPGRMLVLTLLLCDVERLDAPPIDPTRRKPVGRLTPPTGEGVLVVAEDRWMSPETEAWFEDRSVELTFQDPNESVPHIEPFVVEPELPRIWQVAHAPHDLRLIFEDGDEGEGHEDQEEPHEGRGLDGA